MIHVHNLYPMLSPAVLRSTAAPVVVTLHNYRLMCLPATFLRDGRTCEDCLGHGPWRGVAHRCYRGSAAGSASLAAAIALHRRAGTFRRVARFLAVSEFVRDKHIEAGIEPDRIAVKPNFVDPLPRREGPGEYFLFLGRLSPEKGVATADRGAGGTSPRGSWWSGDGEERARLAAIAPPTVEFHDAVPADRVGEYLARCARAGRAVDLVRGLAAHDHRGLRRRACRSSRRAAGRCPASSPTASPERSPSRATSHRGGQR